MPKDDDDDDGNLILIITISFIRRFLFLGLYAKIFTLIDPRKLLSSKRYLAAHFKRKFSEPVTSKPGKKTCRASKLYLKRIMGMELKERWKDISLYCAECIDVVHLAETGANDTWSHLDSVD